MSGKNVLITQYIKYSYFEPFKSFMQHMQWMFALCLLQSCEYLARK